MANPAQARTTCRTSIRASLSTSSISCGWPPSIFPHSPAPDILDPMRCPFCKASTFRGVLSTEREIDRCTACGALWFDYGEIRELTEGHLPPGQEGEPPPAPPGKPESAEKPGAMLSRIRREAGFLNCPRCGDTLTAVDFQMTGIPVFRCPAC